MGPREGGLAKLPGRYPPRDLFAWCKTYKSDRNEYRLSSLMTVIEDLILMAPGQSVFPLLQSDGKSARIFVVSG